MKNVQTCFRMLFLPTHGARASSDHLGCHRERCARNVLQRRCTPEIKNSTCQIPNSIGPLKVVGLWWVSLPHSFFSRCRRGAPTSQVSLAAKSHGVLESLGQGEGQVGELAQVGHQRHRRKAPGAARIDHLSWRLPARRGAGNSGWW